MEEKERAVEETGDNSKDKTTHAKTKDERTVDEIFPIKNPDWGLRFCQKEKIFKPDRAHYCKVLQKNVMRMDHHCPWLLNTIGLKNQKYFYLFLLYSCLGCNILGTRLLHITWSYFAGDASLAPA